MNNVKMGDKLRITSTDVKVAEVTDPILLMFGMDAAELQRGDALKKAFNVGDEVTVTSFSEYGEPQFEFDFEGDERVYTIYASEKYDNTHCFEKLA